MKFCWRPRNVPMSQPELDLLIPPSDGSFVPYKGPSSSSSDTTATKSPTNGRIFVLKFQSSTQRHLFWLQSKSQHTQGDASWFSPRDLKLGDIVNRLLQGDEVNAQEELNNVQSEGGDDDGDAEMKDATGDENTGTQVGSNSDSSTRHQGGDGGQSGNPGADGGAA